jgi:uroporphyrinogen-III decarboxylase
MGGRSRVMEKSADEMIRERNRRVEDAARLKEPDRVPFVPFFSFFSAKYSGLNCREYMYEYDKIREASKKTILDFEPDQYINPYGLFALGPILDILDFKQLKWSGHGVSYDHTYQFVEDEYMLADEYDAFLFDPTGYMLRVYLPRVCGLLEPFKKLPDIPAQYYLKLPRSTAIFAVPEFSEMLQNLSKAGIEARKMVAKAVEFAVEMNDLGFPPMYGGTSIAPFDYFGDNFRGTRGIMLDMYRNPDKLKEALKKVIPILAESAIADAKRHKVPYIFMPLHKCPDGFMSLDQFKTFYWPTLHELMMIYINEGLVPCPVWEGHCNSRLEIIKDIPKGKAIYWFEQTDIFKAKEVLGDRVCIRGNVPPSLLITGSTQKVEDCCKKLIDIVGRDGGFIMDGAIGIPDEARPDNVKTMEETTKEYGRYR